MDHQTSIDDGLKAKSLVGDFNFGQQDMRRKESPKGPRMIMKITFAMAVMASIKMDLHGNGGWMFAQAVPIRGEKSDI